MSAPALRSLSTTKASRGGREPNRASDPAVVCIASAVAILSLMKNRNAVKGTSWTGVFALLV